MPEERLDKTVALSCGLSRKDARGVILSGGVTVDGGVARDVSRKVDADFSVITVNGVRISYQKYIYIMLNKPAGVLSASNDKSRETVVDIVSRKLKRKGLFPVGRLDKDTTGLLIITDDGDFGHRVISPKSGIAKEYAVKTDKPLSADDVKTLERGAVLADGTVCRPAKISDCGKTEFTVTITEGKYHEIKRMLGTVGAGVEQLKRLRIGGLLLDPKLESGAFREMSLSEIELVWK